MTFVTDACALCSAFFLALGIVSGSHVALLLSFMYLIFGGFIIMARGIIQKYESKD